MKKVARPAIFMFLVLSRFAIPINVLTAEIKISSDPWLVLDQTQFSCYSQVDREKTKEVGLRLEALYQSLFFISGQRSIPPAVPVHVYLFKNSKTLNAYRWMPASVREAGASFFASQPDGIYIGFVAGETLPATIISSISSHFFSSLLPHAPRWFEVGLPAYLGNLTTTDATIKMGMPLAEQLSLLRLEKLEPWKKILQFRHEQQASLDKKKTRLYNAQAWVMVHYLIHGKEGTLRDKIGFYLDAVGRGDARAFEAAFAIADSSLGQILTAYIKQADMNFNSIAVTELIKKKATARMMRPEEIYVRLGDLLAHQSPERLNQAQIHLRAALERDSTFAPALSGMAFVASRRGEREQALTYYARAVESGNADAWTYYQYAACLLTTRPDCTASLNGGILVQARSLLQRAIDANDSFTEAYVLYGRTFLSGPSSALHSGISALETALSRLPSRADVAGDLLTLYVLNNDTLRANYLTGDVIGPRWGLETTQRLQAAMAEVVFNRLNRASSSVSPSETIRAIRYLHRFISDVALRQEAEGLLEQKEKSHAQSLYRQAQASAGDDEKIVTLLQEALPLQCDTHVKTGIRSLYSQTAKRLQRSLYSDAMMKANDNQFKQAEKFLLRAIELDANAEITRRSRDLLKMVQTAR